MDGWIRGATGKEEDKASDSHQFAIKTHKKLERAVNIGGLSGIKWRQVFFPIRVGFDGLCRWVEWDKVALGGFFPSGWDLMDCEPAASGWVDCV